MQKWKKLGLIFDPTNRFDWMQTHAQLPVVIPLNTDKYGRNSSIYRIYFATRDCNNRSQVGFIDIDINNPNKILNISEKPVLKYGEIGYFDEHGVYPSSIIEVNNRLYMYYIGWNKGAEYPMFYASIGLAISEDGGYTFKKYSKAPIMNRSEYDPCMVTAPFVLKNGKIYRMYYVSGFKWERLPDGTLKSFYKIKYAESKDGINWKREGITSIDFTNKEERNISRACIFREHNIYKAYFAISTVTQAYKIKYAESKDGISFVRKDSELSFYPSESKFDSEMMCYPYVIKHHGRKYMFYNGNNYGKEGILLAVEEQK